MIVRIFALFAMLVPFALAIACDDDGDNGDGGAQAEFCDELEAFANTFAGWSDLSPDSSRNEFQQQLDATRDALDELRGAAAEYGEAEIDDLEAAYQELEAAVSGITEDTPTGEAITTTIEAVGDFAEALTATVTLADCREG